ncbi:MAG TPA: hypothetical protein VFN20_10280 [Candidatus Acidoferrum sp.]|nr:hypothetical protein [Candidatus Acidoferrum sp.]
MSYVSRTTRLSGTQTPKAAAAVFEAAGNGVNRSGACNTSGKRVLRAMRAEEMAGDTELSALEIARIAAMAGMS